MPAHLRAAGPHILPDSTLERPRASNCALAPIAVHAPAAGCRNHL